MKFVTNLRHYLMRPLHGLLLGLQLIILSVQSYATEKFDHNYQDYDALLKQVVVSSDDKLQTRVDYGKLAGKPTQLDSLLADLSAVDKTQYDNWQQPQQLSFLINVYNSFTLKLIVDNWHKFSSGEVKSIRDLGGLFSTAWEQEFFSLFGDSHSLDDVEHQMIRKWFTEPRIHAVLVCAAVSCPPLRNEAFVADKLAQQLDSQMALFIGDDSRNEFILADNQGSAALSSIFKWYRGDFEKGHAGFSSLYDVIRTYSGAMLADDPQRQAKLAIIQQGDYPIGFKDYDWRINDIANF